MPHFSRVQEHTYRAHPVTDWPVSGAYPAVDSAPSPNRSPRWVDADPGSVGQGFASMVLVNSTIASLSQVFLIQLQWGSSQAGRTGHCHPWTPVNALQHLRGETVPDVLPRLCRRALHPSTAFASRTAFPLQGALGREKEGEGQLTPALLCCADPAIEEDCHSSGNDRSGIRVRNQDMRVERDQRPCNSFGLLSL
jgi:hypothetical protein